MLSELASHFEIFKWKFEMAGPERLKLKSILLKVESLKIVSIANVIDFAYLYINFKCDKEGVCLPAMLQFEFVQWIVRTLKCYIGIVGRKKIRVDDVFKGRDVFLNLRNIKLDILTANK
jgi:hypothetical protein